MTYLLFCFSFHGNNLRPDVDSLDTPGTRYSDGYTKGTHVHQYGPAPTSEQVLRKQRPYVARSVVHDNYNVHVVHVQYMYNWSLSITGMSFRSVKTPKNQDKNQSHPYIESS